MRSHSSVSTLFAAVCMLAAGLAITGCSDSSGPQRPLTPEQTADIGLAVSSQIGLSVSSLLASNVANGVGGGLPLASMAYARPLRASPGMARGSVACGTPSQDPIVDTDGDVVPDDVTITFALPECHFGQGTESLEITGALRLSDPTPQSAGFSFNLSLAGMRLVFSGAEGSGSITHNGTQSVNASSTGLSQNHSMTFTAAVTGEPAASFSSTWGATFVPAVGSSISYDQPLPDGAYSAIGTVSYARGPEHFSFALVTSTALQYDASCTGDHPFRSGEVRAVLTGNDGSGYVRVQFQNCAEPSVTFVAENN
ncbi:MAG: hypothetical protein ABR543_04950 [Gemmatimonadaceae bacterium]